jgi:hypothetical protein
MDLLSPCGASEVRRYAGNFKIEATARRAVKRIPLLRRGGMPEPPLRLK